MQRWMVMAAACAAMVVGSSGQARVQHRFAASIERTTYGIAHISADDWRGVGYGVAYAYAQDNLCLLAEEFATVAGERSRHFGPQNRAVLGFQEVDNLSSDLFFRSMIDLPSLRAGARLQPREVRMMTEGYVAGYNRFLRDRGADGVPAACRGQAWVRPITTDDMLRLTEKQMLQGGALALANGIANAAPPGGRAASVRQVLPHPGQIGMGSNGWAFGRETTADGRGLLVGNPHFPWSGPNRLWQMHVTGPEGFDAMGASLPGSPVPSIGFNRDVAWTHTVTAARHITIFQLTLDPADPTRYLVDGESVAMARQTVTVPMPEGTPDVTRTLYATRFGPVAVAPQSGLGWSASTAFAVRDANHGNQRAMETWLRMGRARSVGQIRAVISETLGIPWVNTIAADRHGMAMHADITAVPNVSADKIAACATPLSALAANLATLLDGSRSACNWDAAEGTPIGGLMPARDQAVTTTAQYLTNSNDSYWMSNPRMPHAALSPILGAYARQLSLRTRSNFIETDAMLAVGRVDHARARTMVFANRSLAADLVVGPMLSLCAGRPQAVRGCAALAGWDRTFEASSRGAALFRAFWARAARIPGLWQVPFDPADPVNTPRDVNTAAAGDALISALEQAVAELDAAAIPLDAEWGSVQQIRVGDERIAIHGGPGSAGVLNFQDSRPAPWGGLRPVHGTSYIQIVSFGPTGPVAEAILSYSQSTNPESPHFADQTRAYASKTWLSLPFSRRDIAARRIGPPVRIAE